jgi:hypothetical protein
MSEIPPGSISAAALAHEIGVAVADVDELSVLVCVYPTDLVFDRGSTTTLITATGAEKIRSAVAAEMRPGPPRPAAQKAGAPSVTAPPEPFPAGPHREDLRLTRVFSGSKNILAERANGLEVVLTVRATTHLAPGMVLRDCIRGEMGWSYEGRLPRIVGERQLFFPPHSGGPELPKTS